jgi:hypothetical protein
VCGAGKKVYSPAFENQLEALNQLAEERLSMHAGQRVFGKFASARFFY